MKKLKGRWLVPAAALILTLSIGSAAFAATDASESDTTATTATAPSSDATARDSSTSDKGAPWGKQRSDETLLTGDALSKATAAALAKVGSDATVVRAETDADGNAKYEVHMVKADGTGTTVYLDESFIVVSVEDRGAGGRGGHGGQRSDETPLTGDVLAKVEAAALAEAGSGSTLLRAETDADGNAKYEAHVTKADGTHVTVYLDENYSVVSVEDAPAGGGHGHGARGTQTDPDGTTDSTTGSTTTNSSVTS